VLQRQDFANLKSHFQTTIVNGEIILSDERSEKIIKDEDNIIIIPIVSGG